MDHIQIFLTGLKAKKTAINLINKKYNKRFQYVVTVALNHDEIKKHPHRITKRKSYINTYNWEGIYFLSKNDDQEKYKKKKSSNCSSCFVC